MNSIFLSDNVYIYQIKRHYHYRANALHRDEAKRNRDGAQRSKFLYMPQVLRMWPCDFPFKIFITGDFSESKFLFLLIPLVHMNIHFFIIEEK